MRYYYDDELSATWMAREFGIRFQTYHRENMAYHYPFGWNSDSEPVGYQFSRFYIHSDSLCELEPKSGDLCSFSVEYADRTIGESYAILEEYVDDGRDFWITSYRDELSENIKKIIQRDGKPFHWPKHEKAQ